MLSKDDEVASAPCLELPETGRPWSFGVDEVDASGGSLDVWFLCFDAAAFVPADFDREGIVMPESIRRSVAKRQAEFLCGRRVARQALQVLGLDGAGAQVAIGGAREPLWPNGFAGSISHVAGLACAVACRSSRHASLGLDIERVVDEQTCTALIETAFDADELALMRNTVEGRGFNELITVAFSAKECLFKSAFRAVGRYFDFDAARLTAFDGAGGRLVLTIAESLGGGYEPGRKCEIRFERPFPGIVLTLFAPPPSTHAPN